ncbi:queuine tRNA-ribosyltransferase family protein [Patescibacteria group bacterium]|nr:queuine tRNA-ribosyltransferase family protein [Patescibacteria group bacterium]
MEKYYKKARVGVLKTPHGEIKTPNLAFVATHGQIKLLNKADHKKADPDLMIANTFHLWVNKKVPEIKKAGGIHKFFGHKIPMMTDSGGFQVFSLGFGKMHGTGKIANKKVENRKLKADNPVKISDDGVIFKYNNKKYKLTPKKSIQIQHDIGANIIFVFDECTSPYHNHKYNLEALKRTNDWAVKCLKAHKTLNVHLETESPSLFGIVQGGIYEDLRKKSSRFIGSLDFDGFGIGGSFGEKQMKKIIGWALSGLPREKPRHLLGIGKIKDIFTAVEQGIDLFDCVIPAREARHGIIYTKKGKINIKKFKPLAVIYKKDRLKAQRLATIHNIKFYKNLFREIRQAIKNGQNLSTLRKEYNLR